MSRFTLHNSEERSHHTAKISSNILFRLLHRWYKLHKAHQALIIIILIHFPERGEYAH